MTCRFLNITFPSGVSISLGFVLRQFLNLSFPIVAYVLVFFCKH
jgi:hypothetical protein